MQPRSRNGRDVAEPQNWARGNVGARLRAAGLRRIWLEQFGGRDETGFDGIWTGLTAGRALTFGSWGPRDSLSLQRFRFLSCLIPSNPVSSCFQKVFHRYSAGKHPWPKKDDDRDRLANMQNRCMPDEKHLIESELSRAIIAAFYAVYNYFGYGFAELVYAGALEYELMRRGHRVERELAIQIYYEDRIVAWQRLDMVVDGKVTVEVKSSERMPPFAERQLRNYLCATEYRVGLLLHFGPEPKVHRLVDFPKRVFSTRATAADHSRAELDTSNPM
jgi:GxxExxY protein